MAPKETFDARRMYFVGQSWESSLSVADLQALRRAYDIPELAVMEILGHRIATVDSDGMASWVALYPLMFANGLQLLFCRHIHDILNFLGLAPAQLHPNAWRLLVVSCVIFRRVLSSDFEEYPDLTAQEFLSVYWVLCLNESLCSFQALSSEKRIASLERQHSHIKAWSHQFFFVSGSG